MALGRKQIPVFIFMGFLESGKTTFIKETLMEGQFEDGRKTLLISCEEGEVEVPEELLKKNRFDVVQIEDEEDVSNTLLLEFDKKYKPHRVMIEINGMWDANEVVEAMPSNWQIAEVITTVDSTTFNSYLANMKMMMTNQFKEADLVVFNRCKEEHDRAMFKRMVRAVNRRAQVLFETPSGEVDDDAHEEPPYDVNADVIEIADEDFGIFYIDMMDHLEKFVGKTVKFKAVVYHPKNMRSGDMFVPGRFAMTCCADDVGFIGYPCKFAGASKLIDRDWIMLTAVVGSTPSRELGQNAPFLTATKVTEADKAEEDLVYFN